MNPTKTQELTKKWNKIINHTDLPKIPDPHRRNVLAVLLENQVEDTRQVMEGSGGYRPPTLLGEAAPTNNFGASSSVAGTGAIDIYDPVLISLVRRSMPNLIAYDICGVQPMTGPTGLIFALRARYTNQTGTEALYNEADTTFSSSAAGNTASRNVIDGNANSTVSDTQDGTWPGDRASGTGYTVATGMSTAEAEALGDGSNNQFQEMAFSIEKISVTAVSRALKAEYTMELAQDLKAVHGLDAESELANILSAEIMAEINREVVRTINYTASAGGTDGNVANLGEFDVANDANGRWSVERWKGMVFQVERESHAIARATRRGRGNIIICGADVASAFSMAELLDYTPKLNASLNVDDTGNTFAGVMNGRFKVYIDPYTGPATSAGNVGDQYLTVGYKGSSAFDAGLFYCPYVPLQMVRAVGENTFQPKIGFKTRYGMVANPFSGGASVHSGGIDFSKKNVYYRLLQIKNLM